MAAGQALRMRYQLQLLRQRHRIAPPDTSLVPYAPATDGPMVLHGFAATADVDHDRQRLPPFCLSWLPSQLPPLLFKHDASVIAGKIDHLEYTRDGNLAISATVDHHIARRCNHFSVGITVNAFEMVDADSPDFHAAILQARLDEVSLTDKPANPRAIVTGRHRALYSFGHFAARLAAITNRLKEATT